MNLPSWATPLDFARTHQTYLCDCDYHFPAVATVDVIWLQRIPKRLENKDYHRRYAARKGVTPQEEYEEKREWDTIEHHFTFHLCPVCVWYEAEIRGEMEHHKVEFITAAVRRALLEARAELSAESESVRYKNIIAANAYANKPNRSRRKSKKQAA